MFLVSNCKFDVIQDTYASRNSRILIISLTNLRLDISPPSATKKEAVSKERSINQGQSLKIAPDKSRQALWAILAKEPDRVAESQSIKSKDRKEFRYCNLSLRTSPTEVKRRWTLLQLCIICGLKVLLIQPLSFSDRRPLARRRDGNKKAEAVCSAEWLFLC